MWLHVGLLNVKLYDLDLFVVIKLLHWCNLCFVCDTYGILASTVESGH